ncbi:hypothetical protein ACVW19_003491 [Streptomyces sp. TE5632]
MSLFSHLAPARRHSNDKKDTTTGQRRRSHNHGHRRHDSDSDKYK